MTFIQQLADTAAWSGATRRVEEADNDGSDAGSVSLDIRRDAGQMSRGRRAAALSRIVETEILPRLALARKGGAVEQTAAGPQDHVTTEADTTALVHHLLGRSEDAAKDLIAQLNASGIAVAALYVGIITVAARRLGEMWEEDTANFTQVTIGLGRLQQIVRALSPAFQQQAVNHTALAESVLLLPAPDEHHTLGLMILGEFFQREGWHVMATAVSSSYDAAEMVCDEWVDVACFSIASSTHVEALTQVIRRIRRASRNRRVGVMVGGPLLLRHPDLVIRVGADATAPDAPTAVRQARTLLSIRAAVH